MAPLWEQVNVLSGVASGYEPESEVISSKAAAMVSGEWGMSLSTHQATRLS